MTDYEKKCRWMSIIKLCMEISTKTKADCHFGFWPGTEFLGGLSVEVFEFGYTPWSRGEIYLFASVSDDREALETAERRLVDLAVALGI